MLLDLRTKLEKENVRISNAATSDSFSLSQENDEVGSYYLLIVNIH